MNASEGVENVDVVSVCAVSVFNVWNKYQNVYGWNSVSVSLSTSGWMAEFDLVWVSQCRFSFSWVWFSHFYYVLLSYYGREGGEDGEPSRVFNSHVVTQFFLFSHTQPHGKCVDGRERRSTE